MVSGIATHFFFIGAVTVPIISFTYVAATAGAAGAIMFPWAFLTGEPFESRRTIDKWACMGCLT